MASEIEIMPEGEEDDHTRGRGCSCGPIVEPGESYTVTHRSRTPGDNSTPIRMDPNV